MEYLFDLTKLTEDLVRKHNIAVDVLTEKQVADAIKQAIQAGDFQKLVLADRLSQAVIYLPYMGMERLQESHDFWKQKAIEFGYKPSEDDYPPV